MVRLPDIVSRIRLDTSDLDSAAAETSSKLGAIGSAAGLALAAVGAAGAAAGAALFQAGAQLDEAFDTIRVGTGATGAALEGLKGDFRAVLGAVPATAADAGTAIADLNTRLGLTGEPLQEVSKRVLEMSRLTGTDLSTNIAGVSRLFGDWSVTTEEQAGTLDKLFRASQATGATVDTLSQQVVQFGSPLRQMGFTLDQSLALFGKFEKEGVNIEGVLGGMRQGLARMAKAGEEPPQALARISEEIRTAGSVADANKLAIEAFGARAGPDLAAAIREGRFNLADLVTSIQSGGDTILGAADDTRDFAESWQMFKNQVLLAVEPVATRVFTAISEAMTRIAEVAKPAIDALMDRDWQGLAEILDNLFGNTGRFVDIFRTMGETAETVWTSLQKVPDILDRYGVVIGIVGGLIATVFVPHLIALGVQATISAAKQAAAWVLTQTQAIAAAAVHSFQVVRMVAGWVLMGVQAGINAAKVVAGWVLTAAQAVISGAVQLFQMGLVVAQWVWMGVQALAAAAQVALAWLISIGPIALVIAAVIGLVVLIVKNWDTIVRFTRELWEKVVGFFLALRDDVVAAARAVVDWVRDAWERLKNGTIEAAQRLWDALVTAFQKMENFFRDLPGNILAALGDLARLLVDKGRDVVTGLWDGIRGMGGWLADRLREWVIQTVPGPIARALGISSPSTLFAELGRAIPQGLAAGIEQETGRVEAAVSSLQDAVTSGIGAPALGRGLAAVGAGRGVGAVPGARALSVAPGAVQVTVSVTGAGSPTATATAVRGATTDAFDALVRELRARF